MRAAITFAALLFALGASAATGDMEEVTSSQPYADGDQVFISDSGSPGGANNNPPGPPAADVAACRAQCRALSNCAYYMFNASQNNRCALLSSVDGLGLDKPTGDGTDWQFGAPAVCGSGGTPQQNGPIPMDYRNYSTNADEGPITTCRTFGPSTGTMRARMERRTMERRNRLRARVAAEVMA